jgi:hypothetical protein
LKLRTFFAGAAAVAVAATGTLVSAAHAEEVDADVGGGAAALMAVVNYQNYDLADLLDGNDIHELSATFPRVVMGKNGGEFRKQVLRQDAFNVRVTAASATIKGNRRGTPYAEATTTLASVVVRNGPLASTKLGTIETYCRWDLDGSRGSTTLIDANGQKTQPAPNTVSEIPGLGTITFNEQYIETFYLKDASGNYIPDGNGWFLTAEVLYVVGAHIELNAPLLGGNLATDLYLGFTSCDPVKLPPLSGLTAISTPSD